LLGSKIPSSFPQIPFKIAQPFFFTECPPPPSATHIAAKTEISKNAVRRLFMATYPAVNLEVLIWQEWRIMFIIYRGDKKNKKKLAGEITGLCVWVCEMRMK